MLIGQRCPGVQNQEDDHLAQDAICLLRDGFRRESISGKGSVAAGVRTDHVYFHFGEHDSFTSWLTMPNFAKTSRLSMLNFCVSLLIVCAKVLICVVGPQPQPSFIVVEQHPRPHHKGAAVQSQPAVKFLGCFS